MPFSLVLGCFFGGFFPVRTIPLLENTLVLLAASIGSIDIYNDAERGRNPEKKNSCSILLSPPYSINCSVTELIVKKAEIPNFSGTRILAERTDRFRTSHRRMLL